MKSTQAPIDADQLQQRVLLLISKQVMRFESKKQQLNDGQLRILNEILKVIITLKRAQQQEEKETAKTFSNLTTEELQALLNT